MGSRALFAAAGQAGEEMPRAYDAEGWKVERNRQENGLGRRLRIEQKGLNGMGVRSVDILDMARSTKHWAG